MKGNEICPQRYHLGFIDYLAAASDQVKFYPRGVGRGDNPDNDLKVEAPPKKGVLFSDFRYMKREVISLVKVNERIGKSVLKLSKGPWIKIFRTDAQTLKGEKRRKSC